MQDILNAGELCVRVAEKFRDGIPNGWLLHWDSQRLQSELTDASMPYSVRNRTSFDYSRCNQYDIEIAPQDSVFTYVLTLRLSFVLPYFCLHWTEYDASKTNGRVVAMHDTIGCELESKLRSVVERFGFEELPDQWLSVKIPEFKLELSEDENVTISKCLFDDYDG